MTLEPIFVKSSVTGGHYAFKTEKAGKPFTNNMRECRSVRLWPDDIVADIGAYVGEYSIWAMRNGARKVLCYEPTPSTFRILCMNALEGMHLFNVAVVGDDRSMTTLYLSRGIGVTNSIVKKKSDSIEVKCVRYEDAVREASVVKIDVEGGEYLYNIVQPQLRAIILEFHPIADKPWRSWADKIMLNIEDSGFEPIMRPTFKSGWSLTGSWIKR